MKLRIALAAMVVFALSSCSPIRNHFARKDFRELCEIAQSFPWDKYSADDAAKLAVEFSTKVERRLNSRYFKNTYSALHMVNADEKYALLVQGATEVGVENYSCPIMKDYLEGRFPAR